MFKYGKRLAALALTALLCLPVAAYAEGEITVYSMDGINVYEAEGEFEVNIPAEVSVDPATKKAELSIDATLEQCSNLEIGIESQYDYHLKCGTQELAYYISDKNVVLWKNDTTAESEKQTYTIDIEVTDNPTMSGTYEDYLTFTMERKQYEIVEGTYLLTFDTNDANDESLVISTDHKYVTKNEEYGMLPVPKRDGYTFAGWYTAATDGEEVTDKTKATSDVTLYAHWTEHILKIHYHNGGAEKWQSYSNGNEWTVDPDQDAVVETEAIGYDKPYPHADYGFLDVNRLTRTGYHSGFSWKVGSQYSNHTVVDTNWAPTSLNEYTYYGKDAAEKLDVLEEFKKGNVEVDLYPVWIVNTYTVKYDANADDAEGTTENSSHTYDEWENLTPNGYTRKGYEFVKWNTKEDGTGEEYDDKALVQNLTATNNGTVTLYAQWKLVVDDETVEPAEITTDPTDAEEEPTISDDVTDTDDTKVPADDETDSKDTEDTETPADTDKTEPADKDDTATGTDDVDDTTKDTDIVDKDDADDADRTTEPLEDAADISSDLDEEPGESA